MIHAAVIGNQFVWVEEVQGPLSRRGTGRVVGIDDGPPPPCHEELYRSVYVSDSRLRDYVAEHKGKDNPSGIKGFDGPCSVRYLPFDIDRETEHNGTKRPDWTAAVSDARQLLAHLREVHGVDPAAVPCSLTGGRGVHVYLPASLFGDFEPSERVPEIVSAVASALAQEARIEIDNAIYGRTRLLRVPNSRHRSGNYCVPVTGQELIEGALEELLSLMERLREGGVELEPAAPLESLIALRQQCEVQVQTARPRITRFPKPPPRRATEIVEFLTGLGVPYSSNGKDYLIQCPSGTHTDEQASFSIDRKSGVYHCFGCEISGHWDKRTLGALQTGAPTRPPNPWR
jgi:hypothetical protein